MLDLHQLDYFIHIAEAGSLSKAALQLQLSHSMLSRRIQDLEMCLGIRLFHRTGRGMKLTEYGQQLLPRAQQIVLEAARFSEEANALRGNLSGTVSIGLPGSVATLIAGPIFQAVSRQCPGVFIRFVEVLSSEAEELIASGRIDIGLFYARQANTNKGESALAKVNYYLVGHAGDRLTAGSSVTQAQVARCALVLPSHPNAVRVMIEEAYAKQKSVIYIPCEVNSLSALKEVVAGGTGYTISTYEAISGDVVAGRLQAALITDPPLTRFLIMTVGPKHSLTIASRAVANIIQSLTTKLVAEGHWSNLNH